jgi:hypothetical protein
MLRKVAGLLVAVFLTEPSLALAQNTGQTVSASTQSPSETATAQPGLDPGKLPVSLSRIRRMLAQKTPGKSLVPLKLDFYVDVYGKAPPIDVLQGVDLMTGSVPWSAISHQDLLNVVTPFEYRAGAIPLSPVAYLAARKIAEKETERRRKEAEQRRREELEKKREDVIIK